MLNNDEITIKVDKDLLFRKTLRSSNDEWILCFEDGDGDFLYFNINYKDLFHIRNELNLALEALNKLI